MLSPEKECNSRDDLNVCSVDQLVPEGHLVRKLDKALDFESFRSEYRPVSNIKNMLYPRDIWYSIYASNNT